MQTTVYEMPLCLVIAKKKKYQWLLDKCTHSMHTYYGLALHHTWQTQLLSRHGSQLSGMSESMRDAISDVTDMQPISSNQNKNETCALRGDS